MTNEHIWKKVLRDDEKIEYEFSIGDKYRYLAMIPTLLIGLILCMGIPEVGSVVIFASLFYFGHYLKVANAYVFTDKRVVIHKGLFSTTTTSINYENITDVTVDEPYLERIIAKTGNISINTAGSSSKEVVLQHISEPYEVRKKLDAIRK